jgi:hypothetical protein
MPHRDLGFGSQAVQNVEALRIGNIFQVNAGEDAAAI